MQVTLMHETVSLIVVSEENCKEERKQVYGNGRSVAEVAVVRWRYCALRQALLWVVDALQPSKKE